MFTFLIKYVSKAFITLNNNKKEVFMKAKDVINLLRISRASLTKYVKNKWIEVDILPNGRYNYKEDSVYAFINKNIDRKTYVYARVSTRNQKKDLENQIEHLESKVFELESKIEQMEKD